MISIIATLVMLSALQCPTNLPEQEDMELYTDIHEQAVNNCRNIKPEKVDRRLLWELIEIEASWDPPDELKGMLLAAACYESGYNPKAKGDRKFSKDKKTPKAHGLFQMWPWWESSRWGYSIKRTDPYQAAAAFMQHIYKMRTKAKKVCRFKSEEKIWIAAWVHAIRKPKPGGRCQERPLHLSVLRRWQKNIKKKSE